MTYNKKQSFKALLVFPAALIYWELVFRLFTGGALPSIATVYILLLSVAYSSLGYLLSTLTSKPGINRVITETLLLLTSLAYIVQFLIFRQFKQFYDINTMTGGAGDALTGYFYELMQLLFHQGGIFIVLLLLIPVLVYPFLSRKLLPALPGTLSNRLTSILTSLTCYSLALVLILTSPIYGPVYHGQYNFQSAVSGFGLVTGLRLDLQNKLFDSGYSFEAPEPATQPTEPELTEPPATQPTETTGETEPATEATEPVIEYGYNQLNIDFDKINESAPSQVQELNAYVSSLTPSKQNEYTGLFAGKNLIFITAEAFCAEAIREDLTPTLYRLATKGFQFTDYYQPSGAGTTGGEYLNIFGMIPTKGGQSLKSTANHYNFYTIGTQLDRLGYYGKAYHNNDYTYYNRHITHENLGYSDGFMGYGNGMEDYVYPYWPPSDYEMFTATIPQVLDKQPFNLYYMTVSGHSNYTPDFHDMVARHWDRVKDLPYSRDVRSYFAANLELEDSLTYLVELLEAEGIADDTVICIASDHFPYGLDSDATVGNMPLLSELYGYPVETYLQQDHSRLILWSGCLEDKEPVIIDSPASSLDILPTLFNLFGVEFDSRLLPGRDVFSDAEPLVFLTNYDWKTDLGTYYSGRAAFEPASEDTVIPEGYVDRIKAVVRNKMTYCKGVLNTDYFRYLFAPEQ